jgi:hypothetical protein
MAAKIKIDRKKLISDATKQRDRLVRERDGWTAKREAAIERLRPKAVTALRTMADELESGGAAIPFEERRNVGTVLVLPLTKTAIPAKPAPQPYGVSFLERAINRYAAASDDFIAFSVDDPELGVIYPTDNERATYSS